VVSRFEVMRLVEKDVFFSTTHGGERTGLAAGIATMQFIGQGRVLNAIADLAQVSTAISASPTQAEVEELKAKSQNPNDKRSNDQPTGQRSRCSFKHDVTDCQGNKSPRLV
jgi:hypothetical protein